MPFDDNTFIRQFHDGQFDHLYMRLSPTFQRELSMDAFHEMARSFNTGVKRYHVVTDTMWNGLRYVVWFDDRSQKLLHATIDDDTIVGLMMTPHEANPKTDRRFTKQTYHFPFVGDWFVVWGGTNVGENYHYDVPAQRYAYDFVQTKDDRSYDASATGLDRYYAYRQRIIAPLDGTVVTVVDGLPDTPDVTHPAGNHVVLSHANGEYSLLAHLAMDSIQVKVGDHVKTRQFIGRCGNSGNSSEPHLHFQVMDGPDFTDAMSIRIRFANRKHPVRGQTVTSPQHETVGYESTSGWLDFLFELSLAIPRLFLHFFK